MRKSPIIPIILLTLISATVSGCTDIVGDLGASANYSGRIGDYSFTYYDNNSNLSTAFYYLMENSSYKVVNRVHDIGQMKIRYSGFIQPGDKKEYLNRVVIIDENSTHIPFNVTPEGDHVNISADHNITGFIAYTAKGQMEPRHLTLAVPNFADTIIVVLPANHTTGHLLFGRVRPPPDNITHDQKGRGNLIWNNTNHQITSIDIKYYAENAPTMFYYLLLILAYIGLFMFMGHRGAMKQIRRMREGLERDIRKKR